MGIRGRPSITYRPARRVEADAIGIAASLPFTLQKPTLRQLLVQIASLSKSEQERASNTEVIELLRQLIDGEGLGAVPEQFGGLSLGVGISVSFCIGAVFTSQGGLIVPGINYRRKPLTGRGLQFAFSVMHEQSRALNEDLQGARLGLIQFPQHPRREREAALQFADGALFSYDELARMSDDTYRLWDEVQDEIAEEARKTGTADGGWWS